MIHEKYKDHKGREIEINKNKLLTVAVIGGKESGKSSLIRVLCKTDFSGNSNAFIDSKIRCRKIETDNFDAVNNTVTLGFSFDKLFKTDENEFLMRFIEDNDDTDTELLINKSDAVLVVIDSPSLMELGPGKYGLNYRDETLKMMFNRSETGQESGLENKLVIFVLVKCEKYMSNTDNTGNMNTLCGKLINKYNTSSKGSSTIKYLIENDSTVLISPVITDSHFVFKNFDENGKQIFGFSPDLIKNGAKEIFGYSSRTLFERQLLLTLIRFRIEKWLRNIENNKSRSKRIKSYFNSKSDVKDSMIVEPYIVNMLKGPLFTALIKYTRILVGSEWESVAKNKNAKIFGIKPEQKTHGFAVVNDPNRYYEDRMDIKKIKNVLR
ncbi:MAG: GTPase domain-containing protein [Clostridia bacterium]|nr:GTPase domain-containing protein [Clostridia bacterium]